MITFSFMFYVFSYLCVYSAYSNSIRVYVIYHVSYSTNVHAHFPPQNTRMRVSLRPFARGCLLHISSFYVSLLLVITKDGCIRELFSCIIL